MKVEQLLKLQSFCICFQLVFYVKCKVANFWRTVPGNCGEFQITGDKIVYNRQLL